jgi:uncharacterized membrane protein
MLAQTGSRLFFWSLLLMALVLGLFVVVWWVRRRTLNRDRTSGAVFTLSDLRRMRESGQINTEQYEKLKENVIGAAKREIPGA